MQLSETQKKKLRGLGHQLKPVVTIGSAGLTDAVLVEVNRSLDHHELMKIKFNVGDREQRDHAIENLCEHSGARLIQRVGNVGLFLKLKQKNSKITGLL